jgi:hypothetical protein
VIYKSEPLRLCFAGVRRVGRAAQLTLVLLSRDITRFYRNETQFIAPGLVLICSTTFVGQKYQIVLLRVTWEASLLGGSLLGNNFVNTQQYCRRC